MKLLKENRLSIKSIDRIGDLVPKGKLTLFTGLAGSGKTYSCIKFFNSNGIVPIYFNLDETEIGTLQTEMFGSEYLNNLFDLKYTDINDRVIILDTYTRLESHFNISNEVAKKKIVDQLEAIVSHYNCTLIVIAHPEEYVGKDGVFKDNIYLSRNCYEFLHLEKQIKSSTSKGITTKSTGYFLYVNKGRGYNGDRIISNWMRSTMNPLITSEDYEYLKQSTDTQSIATNNDKTESTETSEDILTNKLTESDIEKCENILSKAKENLSLKGLGYLVKRFNGELKKMEE